MFLTRDTSNQNRERCLFTCEKNDTSNQKPQRRVSFAPKSRLYRSLQLAAPSLSSSISDTSTTRA